MTSHLRFAALLALVGLALAAPARGQSAPDSANPLAGCYSFTGADERSGGSIEERFRLTAEPYVSQDLPGPWQLVDAVPGERLRSTRAAWSVGGNTLIRVLMDFPRGRTLLQFPQIEAGRTLPVEGLLAGPGPEPGVAMTVQGFVVRFPC